MSVDRAAPGEAVPGAAATRMAWMDLLRGAAIGLVLLWHSAAILLLYDIPVPSALLAFNEVFAPYRMPTLMFLSGMLLPASLAKPLPVYLAGKLRFIAYPFVVWTIVHFLLYRPDTTLLDAWFWFTSYLWFLACILVYYLGAPLVRWLPTWIAVLSPLLVTPLVNDTSRRRFFFLAAFFFLGKAVAERRALFDRIVRSRWAWIAAPVALAFGVWSAATSPERYQSLFAVFSVTGIVALVKLAQLATRDGWTGPVQFVGRNSLVFYVTHFPTIILVVLGGHGLLGLPVLLVIPVGFVAALAIGTVCARLSASTPVRWAFVAPARGDLARFSRSRRG